MNKLLQAAQTRVGAVAIGAVLLSGGVGMAAAAVSTPAAPVAPTSVTGVVADVVPTSPATPVAPPPAAGAQVVAEVPATAVVTQAPATVAPVPTTPQVAGIPVPVPSLPSVDAPVSVNTPPPAPAAPRTQEYDPSQPWQQGGQTYVPLPDEVVPPMPGEPGYVAP